MTDLGLLRQCGMLVVNSLHCILGLFIGGRGIANATGRPTAPLVLSEAERELSGAKASCCALHVGAMPDHLRCGEAVPGKVVPGKVVAGELGVHEHSVGKWRRRFLKDQLDGLHNEVRPGRPRTIDDHQIAAVRRSTPSDATHWSSRSMAGATGFSHTTIRRIFQRTETLKLSSELYDRSFGFR
jgi:hypothetical protein